MLSLCQHGFPLFDFVLQELGLRRQRAQLLLHVVQDLDLTETQTVFGNAWNTFNFQLMIFMSHKNFKHQDLYCSNFEAR